VLLLPFGRIDPANTTFGSTESGLTGQSVPSPGLICPKTVGPLQKLGWRESGFLPDLTQSFQRLSHLDVYPVIREDEVSLPLHPERFRKAITSDLIRVSSPLCYPELLSSPNPPPTLEFSQCSAHIHSHAQTIIHIPSVSQIKSERRRNGKKSRSLLGATKYNIGKGTPLQLLIPP